MGYESTLARVEAYFDQTATQTWARLTSDAPVSKIRQTVRAGREEMRATLLGGLPADLTGCRVLDAGCGTGQLIQALAARGAEVLAVDISPALIAIAEARLPRALHRKVTFRAADMLEVPGRFDLIFAMDSLIYYRPPDLQRALERLSGLCAGQTRFTVAPRGPLLMALWYAGQLFPRGDRSPAMVPQDVPALCRWLAGRGSARDLGQVRSGFYISQALEVAP